MRIERQNGDRVGSVWAVFTREEARDLLDSLAYYFECDEGSPGWHTHVGNRDDDNELTIEIDPSQ